MQTDRTTEKLAAELALLAKERGDALRAGDPKRANSKFHRMARIYREISNRGAAAQRQLLALLDKEDPYVRLSVATYALEFDAKRAVPVLEEIDEKESGTLGFTASMVLKQWQNGEFRLP
jgi:HEAT repeat protein